MRASPACQVSLRRFGAWRAAIAALTLLTVLAMAAWVTQTPAPISTNLMTFAVVASVACAALAASLWRTPHASLRWDGRLWHLDATTGALRVTIDLGPWMLLRFTPEDGGSARWLPVQRAGLEAQWHALRCAVYSPAQRPAPGRSPT